MKKILNLLWTFSLTLFLFSCRGDESNINQQPSGKYLAGKTFVYEGKFALTPSRIYFNLSEQKATLSFTASSDSTFIYQNILRAETLVKDEIFRVLVEVSFSGTYSTQSNGLSLLKIDPNTYKKQLISDNASIPDDPYVPEESDRIAIEENILSSVVLTREVIDREPVMRLALDQSQGRVKIFYPVKTPLISDLSLMH